MTIFLKKFDRLSYLNYKTKLAMHFNTNPLEEILKKERKRERFRRMFISIVVPVYNIADYLHLCDR